MVDFTLEQDVFKTNAGELNIFFVGHGSLYLTYGGKTIHIDPVAELADYARLPKADLVLITHEHSDHLDRNAIMAIEKDNTHFIVSEKCAHELGFGEILRNGDSTQYDGIKVEAVPAYNLQHKRPDGAPFHPKGEGNGYVLTFGDRRVYIAGDTENVPEMANLKDIDIAFLPMNLPYTMTPEMVADAARVIRPKILYPYHYGKTDVERLLTLLQDLPDTEIRVRKMA